MRTLLSLVLALSSFAPTLVRASDDTVASLLHREDVQAELEMSARQKEKWAQIDRVRNPQRSGTFENDPVVLVDPADQEKVDAEREKKAWSVLSPDQTVRMRELLIQRIGVRAALREDVQWSLELSDAQKDDLRRAVSKRSLVLRNLFETSKRSRPDPKKVQDVLDRTEREFVEDLRKVLTGEQVEKLAQLGGKPFHFMERKIG